MREILRSYIFDELLSGRPEALGDDDDLLMIGVDSVGMMSLVLFIEERFDVTVPAEDVVIDNFQSIARIDAYLHGRRDGVA